MEPQIALGRGESEGKEGKGGNFKPRIGTRAGNRHTVIIIIIIYYEYLLVTTFSFFLSIKRERENLRELK